MRLPLILVADTDLARSKWLHESLSKTLDVIVQNNISSEQEALATLANFPPDLLVLDVKLNEGCPFSLCQQFQQLETLTPSLFLTTSDETVYMAQALASGAAGYLLKTEVTEETISNVIQRAMQGEKLWTKDQLSRIEDWQRVAGDIWATFTEREREVVTALVNFKSDSEIADDLQISVKTVGNHLTHILEKVGKINRREVARWAVEHKLVDFFE